MTVANVLGGLVLLLFLPLFLFALVGATVQGYQVMWWTLTDWLAQRRAPASRRAKTGKGKL